MIKCVSFDLQGTITDSEFCDFWWISILPKKYAEKKEITEEEAKKEISKILGEKEKYNINYYDDSFWSKKLGIDVLQELVKAKKTPKIDKKFIEYIKKIEQKKIIISTTTNLFIDKELGKEKEIFDKIYSCVDYFEIGGKTPDVFIKVCDELGIKPSEILHIGDNYEMDVENARKAGVNAIHFKGDLEKTIKEIDQYLEGEF